MAATPAPDPADASAAASEAPVAEPRGEPAESPGVGAASSPQSANVVPNTPAAAPERQEDRPAASDAGDFESQLAVLRQQLEAQAAALEALRRDLDADRAARGKTGDARQSSDEQGTSPPRSGAEQGTGPGQLGSEPGMSPAQPGSEPGMSPAQPDGEAGTSPAQPGNEQGSTTPAPAAASAWTDGLSAGGYVQADLAFRQSSVNELDPSTGEPLNEDRFMVRRARLALALERPWVTAGLELDGNTVHGLAARLARAEATVRVPPALGEPSLAGLTVGLFKIPFGFEVVQSDSARVFMERSTVARALFPGELDVGAKLAGGWRFLRYAVALQNGEPAGSRAFPGRDPNSAKDVTGRVGVDVNTEALQVVVGASALKGSGFHEGSPATKPVLVWRDYNENNNVDPGEMQVVPGQSAQASKSFGRFGVGGDASVRVAIPAVGALTVYGEIYVAQNLDRGVLPSDPVTASRDLRQLGYYGAALLELGTCATVGVRYDYYNPDRDARETRAGIVVPTDSSYQTLAVAASAKLDRFRLTAEYDFNRNHLGRNKRGAPANLADNALLLRAQVTF